jgi:hypothetical protein
MRSPSSCAVRICGWANHRRRIKHLQEQFQGVLALAILLASIICLLLLLAI